MQSLRQVIALPGFVEPDRWFAAASKAILGRQSTKPLILFGGASRYAVIALQVEPVSAESFLGLPLQQSHQIGDPELWHRDHPPVVTGVVGLLSYDDWSCWCKDATKSAGGSRYYRIRESVIIDRQLRQMWHAHQTNVIPSPWVSSLQSNLIHPMEPIGVVSVASPLELARFELTAQSSEPLYLATVESVLRDIRAGRFYQANILRFFSARPLNEFSSNQMLSGLYHRMQRYGGPWSALVQDEDLLVASFSPERFVRAYPSENGDPKLPPSLICEAQPIKGTAPRGESLNEDQAQIERLSASEKDRAELAMIVDLMRNDLNRISVVGTVKVIDAGSVKTFARLHHLVATIRSVVKHDLTMDEFLTSLLPAGSITGAPKVEVMRAIRDYEARPRGYFMGNIVCRDDTGRIDSSVLIRTLVSNDRGSSFEFAAGSGIVIRSEPAAELAEITTKCRILTD